MNIFKKLGLMIRSRSFSAPRIPGSARLPSFRLPSLLKWPSISLGQGKIKWVIMGTVSLSVTAVSVGMYFAVIDVVSSSYDWPEPGAAYALGSPIGEMGEPLPAYSDGVESQTLQVNLADNARIGDLTFTNMQLGRTGLTDCVVIQRDATNTAGWLYVDTFKVTGTTSAPSYNVANAEIATLVLAGDTDGHTNGATLDSTVSDQNVDSLRGSGEVIASDGMVDRIIINLMGSATVQNLTFDNAHCSVGAWNLDYIKVGTYDQSSTTRWGTGTGIDTADFVIESTVKYRTATDSLIDRPVSVR